MTIIMGAAQKNLPNILHVVTKMTMKGPKEDNPMQSNIYMHRCFYLFFFPSSLYCK